MGETEASIGANKGGEKGECCSQVAHLAANTQAFCMTCMSEQTRDLSCMYLPMYSGPGIPLSTLVG